MTRAATARLIAWGTRLPDQPLELVQQLCEGDHVRDLFQITLLLSAYHVSGCQTCAASGPPRSLR